MTYRWENSSWDNIPILYSLKDDKLSLVKEYDTVFAQSEYYIPTEKGCFVIWNAGNGVPQLYMITPNLEMVKVNSGSMFAGGLVANEDYVIYRDANSWFAFDKKTGAKIHMNGVEVYMGWSRYNGFASDGKKLVIPYYDEEIGAEPYMYDLDNFDFELIENIYSGGMSGNSGSSTNLVSKIGKLFMYGDGHMWVYDQAESNSATKILHKIHSDSSGYMDRVDLGNIIEGTSHVMYYASGQKGNMGYQQKRWRVSDGTQEGTRCLDIEVLRNTYDNYAVYRDGKFYFLGKSYVDNWKQFLFSYDESTGDLDTLGLAEVNPSDLVYPFAFNLFLYKDDIYYFNSELLGSVNATNLMKLGEGDSLFTDTIAQFNFDAGYYRSPVLQYEEDIVFTVNGSGDRYFLAYDLEEHKTDTLLILEQGYTQFEKFHNVVKTDQGLVFAYYNGYSQMRHFIYKDNDTLETLIEAPVQFAQYISEEGNGVAHDGKVYFTSNSEENGVEVYVTDGTQEGTRLFFDAREGAAHSLPSSYCKLSDGICWVAYDETNLHQIYVLSNQDIEPRVLPGLKENGIYPKSYNALYSDESSHMLYFLGWSETNGEGLFKYDLITHTVDVITHSFNVFPNPTSDALNIVLPFSNSRVELFDLSGKLVKTMNANSQFENLNVSGLQIGTYLLQVTNSDNGESLSQKVIIN